MDASIDTEQIERVLSHLARLKHHHGRKDTDVLESLRPAWLAVDAWDVILEDLDAQRYREHERVVRLPLIGR